MAQTNWRNTAARWGLALAMALSPLLASAQFSDPDPQDTAFTKALNPIFGDVFGAAGTAAIDGALGGLFTNFNAAVLLIAGVITAYTMVAGTMATAHDGSVLGKKWSSMWVPIRTAFGIGMIVPMASGWCAAQLVVFWLVGQSTALASNGWQAYANAFLSPQETLSAPLAGNAPILSKTLFQALICVEAINKTARDPGAGSYVTQGAGPSGGMTAAGGERTFGFLSGNDGDAAHCGRFKHPGVVAKDERTKPIAERISAAHAEAFAALEAELRPLANRVVNNPARALHIRGEYDAAVQRYMSTVRGGSTEALGTGSSHAEGMREFNDKGFIYAGFRQIALYTSGKTASVAVAGGPVSRGPAGGMDGTALGQDVASQQTKAGKALAGGGASGSPDGRLSDATPENRKQTEDELAASFDIEALITEASLKFTQSVIEEFRSGGTNPYAAGINFGHLITAAVQWIAIPLGLLSFGLGLFTDAPAALWSSPVGVILNGLLAGAYASGTALTLLPLIPLVMWLTFVGGWLLLVAEAVIAAPLWMVAHLSPESEGFTGKGSNGYLLLTGVLLRPILGLIGLALSFSIGTVLCNLLDEAFVPLFRASAGENLIGLGSLIAMIFAYVTVKTTILVQSFKTIPVLCDSTMRWIGGGEAHGGAISAANAASSGVERSEAAAVGAITSAVRGGGGGGLGRALRNERNSGGDGAGEREKAKQAAEKAKNLGPKVSHIAGGGEPTETTSSGLDSRVENPASPMSERHAPSGGNGGGRQEAHAAPAAERAGPSDAKTPQDGREEGGKAETAAGTPAAHGAERDGRKAGAEAEAPDAAEASRATAAKAAEAEPLQADGGNGGEAK